MPSLALFLCFAFAFWAYRHDAHSNSYPSASLWIPTLWMMRCGSRNIDYWGFSGSFRLDPLLLLALITLGCVILARRRCRWREIFAHNSALILFYGYIVLSLTWAVSETAESPAVRMFRPIGDLVMALILTTEADPVRAITTAFRRTGILLIPLSLVLIRYFHSLGTGGDKHWGPDYWIGVTTHKNPLGQLCLLSALGFLWSMVDGKRHGHRLIHQKFSLFYLGLIAILFNGGGNANSRSSTSILCMSLAVALFLALGSLRQRAHLIMRRVMIGVVLVCAAALILQQAGTSLTTVVAESYGKEGTLTGRTWLWKDVIRLGMERPFFGAGYGGFWVPSIYPKLSPQVDNGPAEAHNGFLETFANLGLVGVVLLLATIAQSLASAAVVIRTDFEYGRLRLVLLLVVVVMNYSEATFPRGTHLWWYGFLIAAVYARPWVNWPQPRTVSYREPLVQKGLYREEAAA
jgi:O-antigen ligase